MKKHLLAVALLFNGQPSGNVQLATYNGHFADVSTKVVQRHIPRTALQKWTVAGSVLTIQTDSVFFSGFEAQP